MWLKLHTHARLCHKYFVFSNLLIVVNDVVKHLYTSNDQICLAVEIRDVPRSCQVEACRAKVSAHLRTDSSWCQHLLSFRKSAERKTSLIALMPATRRDIHLGRRFKEKSSATCATRAPLQSSF